MALFSMFCFLVLALRSIYCANITVQPVSINTTLNSTVIFTCEAIADVITFRVNGEPANHKNVKDKGFIETSSYTGTLRGELQAIAYDFNNNTEIRCRASNDDPETVVYSDASLLLIQGLLASVDNLTNTLINESSVNLSWTAPYTLNNVPITGYSIDDNSGRILNITDLSYILSPVCDMANVTVTVSAVNRAGVGQPADTSFYYKRGLGPVTNITSSIDNCSIIYITWDSPKVDNCTVSIQHYLLTIYDNITGNIVDNYTVNGTSYQFEDKELFHHRYTYVITAVNELGEGISNDNTFSYQRVPRSAIESTFEILNFTQNNAIVKFNIPVTLECAGEAPENATITIGCNGTEIFTDTYLVEYARQLMNVTGSVLVPQNQECILSIVISNQVGSSEPFELTLNTTPPITVSPSPSPTSSSSNTPDTTPPITISPSPSPTLSPLIPVIIGAVSGSIGVLVAIIATVALLVLYRQRRKKSFTSLQTNNALYLIFRSTTEKSRQSSSSNMQSHEIKNVTETASYVHLKDSPTGAMKKSETQSTILDTDCYSLVGEDTETKAAIKDKQVRSPIKECSTLADSYLISNYPASVEEENSVIAL